MGDAFQPIALSFALIASGGSATDLGLVLAGGVVARLACTLVGGVWADRLRPQTIMVAADLVRAAAAGALAVLYLGAHHPLPLLFGLVAVFGGAGAFFYPAMSSLKPTLVPPAQRRSANATLNAVQTASLTAGPAAAGVLIAAFGAPFGFLVNTLSFLASAATVALIRVRAERAARVGFRTELAGGFSALRAHDWLFWGVVAAGVYHVANGVVLVTVNVVALRDLGGPSALGVIAAAEGLGGVIGSVVAMRARPSRPLVAGFVALGLMPVWVLAYVLAGHFDGRASRCRPRLHRPDVLRSLLGDGHSEPRAARPACAGVVVGHPHVLRGMPVGQALAGVLTDRFGTHPVLVACAGVILVSGVGPLAVRGTRRLRWEPDPAHAPT